MPKQQKKHTLLRRSPIFLTAVLVQFLLIKIGTLPLLLGQLFINTIRLIFFKLSCYIQKIHFTKTLYSIAPKKRLVLTIAKTVKNDHHKSQDNPKKRKTIVVAFLITIGLMIYTFITLRAAYELPNPNKLSQYEKPTTTEFYDRNGKLLYRLYEGRNRSLVSLEDLPESLIHATIAVEDKNFYYHPGIDPMAIVRAIVYNLNNDDLQGASTITQQLIKNTILNSERTLSRKIREVILSFWTEALYSKQDILKMYFNEAPYGGPFWGIEAASQGYFGKATQDLTLAESAYLAGLPASPTRYSPYGTKPDLGKSRQKEVLRRMREEGYITPQQEEEAGNTLLSINPPINNIKAPHFVMYIKDQLSLRYGPRVVSQGGLKIYTTLDYALQEKIEDIVASQIEDLQSLNVQNGAAMVTDASTGQILAMVGSRDYRYPNFGNYNATTTLRQPGSSIKPVTYAAAFEEGLSPGNTVLDVPTNFKDAWGNKYSPVNYDGNFHGAVSVRQALGSSYNIPAVRILEKIGIEKMLKTSKKLGITTFTQPERYGLSITLGAAETKMIDMMSVYGSFSQNGIKHTPTGILKVIDSQANILEEYENDPKQVIRPEIAFLITNILADNKARTPAFGSQSLLNFPGFEVAVKTGTSDNKRDNWTFGYTPKYVVGTWVGNPNNQPMDSKLTSGVTGAAPIWNKIMHLLVDEHLPVPFIRPEGIADVFVEGRKDLAILEYVKKQQSIVDQMKNNKTSLKKEAFNIFSATYSAITSKPSITNY